MPCRRKTTDSQTCSTHPFTPHLAAASSLSAEPIIAPILQVSARDETVVSGQPDTTVKLRCAFLSRRSPLTNGVYKYFPKAEAGKSFRASARTLPQLLTKNTISGNVRLISSITEGNIYNINKTGNTTCMDYVDRPTCTPACHPLSCCTGPGTSWLQ